MNIRPELSTAALDDLCNAYDITTDMGRAALEVALENVALLDRKHRDYGPGNINQFGEFGIVVRLSDKFERLRRLITSKTDAANEPLEDTYQDIANYATIALLVRNNRWK